MAGLTPSTTVLNAVEPYKRTVFNRIFAAVYASAILALLSRHLQTLSHSTTPLSFSISISLFISDVILAFMWATAQAFRMRPIRRQEFPEKLKDVVNEQDFPAMDVFICTADPYKEPPMGVVNTALSVMAYDYPAEKISVYVSDDGGSALTLFALMEAAKFATHWLPFCRRNNVMKRSPNEYFASESYRELADDEIKVMYESMKMKVEHVVETGKVDEEFLRRHEETKIFDIWTNKFTKQNHPAVIQVISNGSKDKDVSDALMPNLIYVSREKSNTSPHHFKAGALNALLRVSAVMTNAPIIQTQDCDMFSNDPQTPLRVMCYVSDASLRSELGFVQFPQVFHGVNETDIYACEYKRLFHINPSGMDGFRGPNYVGSGCFFQRRAFFGTPSSILAPETLELRPDHPVDRPISSEDVLALAHNVAGCNYENLTEWGSQIGFFYGSLVEDFNTGYRLQCNGWRGLICKPKRAAFMGNVPITLFDALSQCKRWSIGLLEVGLSKHGPLSYGIRCMGFFAGLGYAHYSFWAIWSIPVTFYAFVPQLALLNGLTITPEISNSWFLLYVFLFVGAYGQDLVDFVLGGGNVRKWWNAQRMWMIRGVSCYLFATIETVQKSLGLLFTHGFTVTSKVLDDEENKRYEKRVFEFGVASPMFVPMTMAAIINLFSFIWGMKMQFFSNEDVNQKDFCLQTLLSGFVVLNSWPIYEAMVLRSDKGKMPWKISVVSLSLIGVLCLITSFVVGGRT